jgi:hypothetical protein
VDFANTTTFLDSLFSISDRNLWHNLHIDDDGSWLIHSINNDSLDICNDGSYMPNYLDMPAPAPSSYDAVNPTKK